MRKYLTLGALCAILAAPMAADAGSVGATLTLGGTVAPSCTLSTITPPQNFNIAPGQAIPQASGSLVLICNNGSSYTVGLDVGQNGTDGPNPLRAIKNGTNLLSYTIYRDANDTLPFGDMVGTNTLSGVGTGDAQTVTFWVLLAKPAATLPIGAYEDTVQVTVTY